MSIGPWDFGGFDIVVLLIIGMSGLMAFARGFFRELVSIAALAAGLIAALFLFGRFQGAANELIQPVWLADGALGLGAFFIVYFLVTVILRGITKRLQGREIGFVDRIMGFVFGTGRGLLISSLFVVVLGVATQNKQAPEWIKNATFYPVLRPIADAMLSVPFAQVKEAAEDTIELGREFELDELGARPDTDVDTNDAPDTPQSEP